MLVPLAGVTLIEWVLRRLSWAQRVSAVVVATSTGGIDRALVEAVQLLGAAVFRGSEHDVLDRVIGAAMEREADNVVRICADNPFVDGREVDRLIECFDTGEYDYAFNHVGRLGCTYPDGLGAEICAVETLRGLARRSTDPRDREHVTWSLWQPDSTLRIGWPATPKDLAVPRLRFDVDIPTDVGRLEVLIEPFRDRWGTPAITQVSSSWLVSRALEMAW